MSILSENGSFAFSKPLVAILATTLILASLLAISMLRNLHREQQFMKKFLLDEGLTLIRSFEAGARTTMRHHMGDNILPIETLVQETAKTSRIAYISIITEDGTVVAGAGNHDIAVDTNLSRQALQTGIPVARMTGTTEQDPIFEIITTFRIIAVPRPPGMGMMGHGGWRSVTPQVAMLKQGRAVIHLGLHTREFVDARRQDIQHSLFMGGLLLLLGTAGFYFLFLYQNMVVTRTTLATMKLYTKNIIESMPDGLFTLDSQGRIVSCNPKAMEFTNMDIRSLKGRCPEELFPGWPKTNMLRSGVSSSFSYTFAHEDGNEIPMEVSGSILRDNQGHNLGAVFLLRDLRAVRSMEQQLARSRRLAALGRMAAGIAHEIRNPLGTLRGFAQYFGSQADDEAAREYSALMIGEVDRLNESISSLLQFSRPREPEFNRIEPANLLEKAGRLLEYDLKEKDIILQKSCNCSQPIMADGDLLLQVLLNLLKNALNVSQPGSTVELFCRETRDDVRITVKDNGTGMDRAEREQMFDPFFTTRKSGTGLGLAVSHQIVEQHDGQFEVESGVGRGTAITVILPRRYNPNKDKDKKSRDKA